MPRNRVDFGGLASNSGGDRLAGWAARFEPLHLEIRSAELHPASTGFRRRSGAPLIRDAQVRVPPPGLRVLANSDSAPTGQSVSNAYGIESRSKCQIGARGYATRRGTGRRQGPPVSLDRHAVGSSDTQAHCWTAWHIVGRRARLRRCRATLRLELLTQRTQRLRRVRAWLNFDNSSRGPGPAAVEL